MMTIKKAEVSIFFEASALYFLLFSSPGMGLVIYFFQPVLIESGIHLSCGNIGMSHHFLDGLDIGPIFDKMHRKGMSEHMRCYLGLDAGFFRISLYYFPKALSCHRMSETVYE